MKSKGVVALLEHKEVSRAAGAMSRHFARNFRRHDGVIACGGPSILFGCNLPGLDIIFDARPSPNSGNAEIFRWVCSWIILLNNHGRENGRECLCFWKTASKSWGAHPAMMTFTRGSLSGWQRATIPPRENPTMPIRPGSRRLCRRKGYHLRTSANSLGNSRGPFFLNDPTVDNPWHRWSYPRRCIPPSPSPRKFARVHVVVKTPRPWARMT